LTSIQAAAFQAAVWEIINEDAGTAYSVTKLNGATYASYGGSAPAWVTQANTWLTSVWNDTNPAPDIGLRVLANSSTQDFALVVPCLGSNPIPEPLTMAGVALGLCASGAYVSKRRKG
jgi:hypothetical protein